MANWTGKFINISFDKYVAEKATSFFEQKKPSKERAGRNYG